MRVLDKAAAIVSAIPTLWRASEWTIPSKNVDSVIVNSVPVNDSVNVLYQSPVGTNPEEYEEKYFEFKIDEAPPGVIEVGVVTEAQYKELGTLPGLAFDGDLKIGGNVSEASWGSPMSAGDSAGLLLGVDNSTVRVWLYHNRMPMGLAFEVDRAAVFGSNSVALFPYLSNSKPFTVTALANSRPGGSRNRPEDSQWNRFAESEEDIDPEMLSAAGEWVVVSCTGVSESPSKPYTLELDTTDEFVPENPFPANLKALLLAANTVRFSLEKEKSQDEKTTDPVYKYSMGISTMMVPSELETCLMKIFEADPRLSMDEYREVLTVTNKNNEVAHFIRTGYVEPDDYDADQSVDFPEEIDETDSTEESDEPNSTEEREAKHEGKDDLATPMPGATENPEINGVPAIELSK